MCAAHHRIARQVCTVADEVAIGDLGIQALMRGHRGRLHRRMALAKPAHMWDTVIHTGKALGVDVRVVDECGTTGTCPRCLEYTKHPSNVSVFVFCLC